MSTPHDGASDSAPNPFADSIKQRLFNRSKASGETLNIFLVRFSVERLLYRLSKSAHANDFILKGAVLFSIWADAPHRPTLDVDLLGFGEPSPENLTRVFQNICGVPVQHDGLVFAPSSVVVEPIRADSMYDGLRVRLLATLGKARIPMQIDVGFGDSIIPDAPTMQLPSLLDLPSAIMRTYPPETVIAEKLDAIVTRGMTNSRMKDYFDLWTLSCTMKFEFALLRQAIAATFQRRGTPWPSEMPAGLTNEFAQDSMKQIQWAAFTRKLGKGNAAPALSVVVTKLREFVWPLLVVQVLSNSDFMQWKPHGPWHA